MTRVSVEPEWVTPTADRGTVRRLSDTLGCSTVLATVLTNRGVRDPATADRQLDPTVDAIHLPAGLPDIEAAVERLSVAIDRTEDIAVFGDRDVDGITGCAILTTLLRNLGASPSLRVPGKWDGYGLSEDAVDDLAEQAHDLLVTVDCGTTAHDPIDRARATGLDVVVIDHHDPDEALPTVTACVNPRREDGQYPNPDLAAGALAWKVGQALLEHRDPRRIEDYHRQALPLAAVATVCDYMPLTLENRAIVQEGFDRLENCGLPGLVQSADHCDVGSMRDLRWSLVPLLNAAQEAESGDLMLDLLLAGDSDRIDELIDRLETYRAQRRRERAEQLAHLEACVAAQVDDPETTDIVFVETDRYVGGGPMSELSRRWHRPVITYRREESGISGGGRTEPDVDLLALYRACEDLLEEYWGHPGAAGFRVAPGAIDAFEDRVTAALRDRYDPAALRPTIDVDVMVDPTDLDREIVTELDRLGPFGTANDEPIVMVEEVTIVDGEWFGDENRHWKTRPAGTEDLTVIDWGGDTIAPVADPPFTCDIAGTLSIDEYANAVSLTPEAIRPLDGGAG